MRFLLLFISIGLVGFLIITFFQNSTINSNWQKTLLSNAVQGDKLSQYLYGMMYYDGDGAEQDYKEAFKWLSKAANQGYPEAQYYIGVMYYDGDGVEQDHYTAMVWLNKADKNGVEQAKHALDWTNNITEPNLYSDK